MPILAMTADAFTEDVAAALMWNEWTIENQFETECYTDVSKRHLRREVMTGKVSLAGIRQ